MYSLCPVLVTGLILQVDFEENVLTNKTKYIVKRLGLGLGSGTGIGDWDWVLGSGTGDGDWNWELRMVKLE